MARSPLIRSEHFAYHVTVRSNNKEWFYISMDDAWRVLCESLAIACNRSGAIPYSFVLMSNHFHFIVQTPNRDLDKVMHYSLSKATRWIQRRTDRINHIFGNRYKWSLLDNPYSLAYVYKYVYRNPVRAGLTSQVQNYQWSTCTDLSSLPISERIDGYWAQIPRSMEERLRWLNTAVPAEQENLIGKAARRFKFEFSTNSNVQAALRQLRMNYLAYPIPY